VACPVDRETGPDGTWFAPVRISQETPLLEMRRNKQERAR